MASVGDLQGKAHPYRTGKVLTYFTLLCFLWSFVAYETILKPELNEAKERDQP